MTIRFTATLNAFNRGIQTMTMAKAVQMIEDWEAALSDTDVPGVRGIARDLASLRRQLESSSHDATRIAVLLERLGTATSRIAARTDQHEDKLRALGEALTHSSQDRQGGETQGNGDAATGEARRGAAA